MSSSVAAQDWEKLREDSRQRLPEVLADRESLPHVLLPYQQMLLQAMAEHPVVVVEKSRRIGATWGIGADAVLSAGAERSAGGQDVFYIGYNLDMTREFVDVCAMWAKAFSFAASEVCEFLFTESGEGGSDREIKAFRISFASGFEIVALCSRPRSLRGRQGYVILDEFAFHDETEELLKAALALLMWGGKVLVISTHDGADNAFAQLIAECRAGKRPYKVLRITFDDALRDGLYRRICLVKGKAWTADAEQAWRDDIVSYYGDAADEELHCIPRRSGGKYFSRVLLEARARPVPIVRWSADSEFVDLTDDQRTAECQAWCTDHLRPLLDALPPSVRSFLGEDFGRTGDLTVLWPLTVEANLHRTTPFLVELRNIPFREQERILLYLCEMLPHFSGAALDARGNGQYLAERARQTYGTQTVAEVMLSEAWYREHMPPFKAALEDDQLSLPADGDVLDDFRSIEVVRGVPRVVERSHGKTGQRHGDSAIAAVLAYFASSEIDGGAVEFSAAGRRESLDAWGGPDGTLDGFM